MKATNKNKLDFNLLQIISRVYKASKNSKVSPVFMKKVSPQLELLSSYFQINKRQAFLLANLYAICCEHRSVEFSDLGRHLGSKPIDLMPLQEDLELLKEKGILIRKRDSSRGMSGLRYETYQIEESVNSAVIKNLPLPELKNAQCKDIFELLHRIYSNGKDRNDGIISTLELYEETKRILSANKHLSFADKVSNMELGAANTYFLLHMCWKTLSGKPRTDLDELVEMIFDSSFEKARYVQKIISGENELVSNKWIELEECFFVNDMEVTLGKKGVLLLEEENIKLFLKDTVRDNVINPESIGEKTLFFGGSEQQQLKMLEEMLLDKNLLPMQERLKVKSLPQGIAVLLYGAPGTGKTESVYQFARKTGRQIMHVDISESKSMWFGGSEKKIKQIFTDYNEFFNKTERIPILLFNEADAILSKRKDSNFSNVSQTENAMQNIILEEMEKFKGILFATSNLTGNMDSAFERRFLFKVEFHKPDNKIREKIWKSKFEYIPETGCAELAKRFDFSGGQIGNIVRKCEMFEILNGTLPDIGKICEFCDEELINKECRNSIGFKINNN
ncbi:MAG TPA: ATP-binding protein [Paludibacteraceae bacterium]|nr:ATP-binding protein [Paludibacteraceae bacterium]